MNFWFLGLKNVKFSVFLIFYIMHLKKSRQSFFFACRLHCKKKTLDFSLCDLSKTFAILVQPHSHHQLSSPISLLFLSPTAHICSLARNAIASSDDDDVEIPLLFTIRSPSVLLYATLAAPFLSGDFFEYSFWFSGISFRFSLCRAISSRPSVSEISRCRRKKCVEKSCKANQSWPGENSSSFFFAACVSALHVPPRNRFPFPCGDGGGGFWLRNFYALFWVSAAGRKPTEKGERERARRKQKQEERKRAQRRNLRPEKRKKSDIPSRKVCVREKTRKKLFLCVCVCDTDCVVTGWEKKKRKKIEVFHIHLSDTRPPTHFSLPSPHVDPRPSPLNRAHAHTHTHIQTQHTF